MLKSELLEKLSSIEDTQDINETIQGIEGLTKTFDLKTIGLDDFKTVLEANDIAKTYYQSSLDSGIGKGVASYKENFSKNDLPKLIDEGIKAKSLEGLTEDQIKYKNLESEVQQMKQAQAKAEMTTKYTKIFSDKGLSTDLLDLINLSVDNEEFNNTAIDKISEILNTAITSGINSKITENPPIPSKSEGLNNLTGVEAEFYSRNPNLMV